MERDVVAFKIHCCCGFVCTRVFVLWILFHSSRENDSHCVDKVEFCWSPVVNDSAIDITHIETAIEFRSAVVASEVVVTNYKHDKRHIHFEDLFLGDLSGIESSIKVNNKSLSLFSLIFNISSVWPLFEVNFLSERKSFCCYRVFYQNIWLNLCQ